MNGLRVFTVIECRQSSAFVWQNTQANFSLLSISSRRSVRLLFLRLGTLLSFIRPMDPSCVMSFHLVPLLPRLVAMVARFFVCDERKVSNFIYYFLHILFLIHLCK